MQRTAICNLIKIFIERKFNDRDPLHARQGLIRDLDVVFPPPDLTHDLRRVHAARLSEVRAQDFELKTERNQTGWSRKTRTDV